MATPSPQASPRRAGLGIALAVVGLAVLAAAAWLWPGDPPAIIAADAPPKPPVAPAPAPQPPAASPPVAAAPPAAAPAPATPGVAAPGVAAPSVSAPPAPVAPPATVAPPAAAPPAATPAPAATPPRFDIVRVSPQGSTVIAGRAAPGVEVILRSNGQEFARARADAQGQWVLADAPPLLPGTHEITLAARDAAGTEIAGDGTVVAVVPAPAAAVAATPAAPAPAAAATPPTMAAPTPAAPASVPAAPATVPAAPATVPAAPATVPAAPLVVLTTPQGPTLLQAPGRAASRLGLDLVDYDDAGEIRFAGTAPPGAVVRIYVDEAHVGDARAGADGRWALVPPGRIAQGEHRLRLDQMDGAGRGVAARVELPFQRAAVAAADAGPQRVVVQPRQNLWRIARHAYGQGVRYTEIFAANRDIIADPAKIYPGQVFTVPGASTPSPANRSR